MDFNIAAPGGAAAGVLAVLVARGADPAIDIPPLPHFMRRITGLTLQPVPGALVPVPTTCQQSIVELILGPILSTGFVPAVRALEKVTTGIFPAKYEAALTQLEAEPAGVGLDPTKVYTSIEHAAAEVLAAIIRVAAQPGGLHPSYLLTVADTYALEPVPVGAPAAFQLFCAGPSALTLGALEYPSHAGLMLDDGFISFIFYGRSLSMSRDGPGHPTRRAVSQMAALVSAASLAPPAAVGAMVTATAFASWIRLTHPTLSVILASFSALPESREQNLRDRHVLTYGTNEQKESLMGRLVLLSPLREHCANLTRILQTGANPPDATGAMRVLVRLISNSASAMVTDPLSVSTLNDSLAEPVRSLSTPGVDVSSLAKRLAYVQLIIQRSRGASGSGSSAGSAAAPGSIYSGDLTTMLDSAAWRATETNLQLELAQAAPNALKIVEELTNSVCVGARRLALGHFGSDDGTARLLSLSVPLYRAIDFLAPSKTVDGKGLDALRYRVVADCLVADPVTRLPTSSAEVSFHLTFPHDMAKQVLRGAIDELDWMKLLALVQSAKLPGTPPREYPTGIFDPLVPPLLSPLLLRLSRLLGIPVAAPLPPAPAIPNYANINSIVQTVAAQFSIINSTTSGFTDSNNGKLVAFAAAAWREGALTISRVYSARNPAGPVLDSIFERARSGAMELYQQLADAIIQQSANAQRQPELNAALSMISAAGGLEQLIEQRVSAAMGSRGRRSPSPGPPPRTRSPSPAPSRASQRDRSSSRSRDGKKAARSPSRSREASPDGLVLGSLYRKHVRHSADRSSFWYVNDDKRISPVYPYEDLERIAGKTRHELDFPVILSRKKTHDGRAMMCGFVGKPGHEHGNSSAHTYPFSDFLQRVDEQFPHFRQPATSPRGTSSANHPRRA